MREERRGSSPAERIYAALTAGGMSRASALGMLGNMYCESGLVSANAQNGMTGLSDAEYTAAVDSGAYQGFASDSVGYGLCQWTFPSRKAELLAFAASGGKSVGDEAMQLEFCLRELKRDYASLWSFLCRGEDVYEAAERICREYERPAVNNVPERCQAALRLERELEQAAESATPGGSAANAATPAAPGGSQSATAAPATVRPSLPLLRFGAQCRAVQLLQLGLEALGFPCGRADGILGVKTQTALIGFQRRRSIDPDGVCGQITWTEIFKDK